jgi:hypothetical protein
VIGAAGAVAILLAVGGASEPVEPAEANLAPCGLGRGVGAGSADRRDATAGAGPLALDPRPLRSMRRARDGQLYAHLGVVVTGHRFVVLSVPLALRNRVFLYYGQILDNRGRTATSLFRAPGYAETEFEPCPHDSRTAWSGGVRVIGDGPVSLLVTVEGRSRSLRLPLGPPRAGPSAT